MNRWFRAVGALVLAGALAACGGGGGDDDETPPVNTVPVASAGADQTVDVGATVSLDGSASSDADGDTLTYQWSITTKPATSAAALSSATAQKPTFVVDVAGTYALQLIVSDGKDTSAADTVAITVNDDPSPNGMPIAKAGADQTVALGQIARLDGRASTDPDGDTLTYKWSVTTRPAGSTAQLSSTSISQPTLAPDVAGTYFVSLIVNDGVVDSPADTVTVTATTPPPVNRAPVAEAGPAQTVTVGATARLDGRASSDPDGDSLTYRWSVTTRPGGSTAQLSSTSAEQPTLVPDRAGSYVVSLVVNDGLVDSPADTVTVTATTPPPVNRAPVAEAGPAQTVDVGATVPLDGSGSSDADGDTLTYQWSITTKPATSAATLSSTTAQKPTFVADIAGSYVVSLVVNDGRLSSPADTVTVTAKAINRAPVANAGAAQTVTLGQTARLDGRASSDPDGDALTFEWSIKSRPIGSTAELSSTTARQPTLVPDVTGAYVVSLIVRDRSLASAPSEVSVTATLPPSAPAAVARVALDAVAVGSTVALDGTASSDADGDPLTYKWTLGTKPAGSAATLDDRTAATARFTADVEGLYSANLVVNDGTSDSEPARVTVVAVKVKTIGEEVTDPGSGLKLTVISSQVSDAGGGRKTYKLRLSARNDTAAAITGKRMALVFDTGDATVSEALPEIAAGATFTRDYDFSVPAEWIPLVWQYDPNATAPRVDATKLQWLMPIPTP